MKFLVKNILFWLASSVVFELGYSDEYKDFWTVFYYFSQNIFIFSLVHFIHRDTISNELKKLCWTVKLYTILRLIYELIQFFNFKDYIISIYSILSLILFSVITIIFINDKAGKSWLRNNGD